MNASYRLKTSVPLAFDVRPTSEQKGSVVLLPLRSQRVLVSGNHLLSLSSQRQLRTELNNECSKAFSRVEELINIKLLHRGMTSLQDQDHTPSFQTHISQKMHDLTCHDDIIPTDDWFHRRSCQTFALYFYYFAQKQQRRALKHWHDIINHERTILYRFFDRWNVKSSQIRLNRMNARRFLFLTRTLSRKLKSVALADAIKRWIWHRQWQRHLVRVRLLFVCWKTVVTAISKRRRRLRVMGLQAFKLHHEHAQMGYQDSLSLVYRLKFKNIQYRALFAWTIVLKRIKVLQRILRLHRPLYAAFYTWKSLPLMLFYQQYTSSPRTSRNSSPRRSRELQGRRVVAYQSSTGAVVTRQIVAHRRPPTTPCISGRRAGSSSSNAKRSNSDVTPKDVKRLSPLDKLMIRLNSVKEFEKSFEEVERVRRLQHSIERKQFVAKTPVRDNIQDNSFLSQQSRSFRSQQSSSQKTQHK